MTQILVTKRDGRKEPFQLDKIHKVLEWATDDINGVSISEIELRANIQLYDGIPAYDIHELLIKSASELISEETPNYQYVAARLVSYKLRKEAYGQYEPWSLDRIIIRNVDAGYYSTDLLYKYSQEEIDLLNDLLRHERDNDFSYAGIEQLRSKYLVRDKKKKIPFETPQVMYMAIGMTLFVDEKSLDNRLSLIADFYELASQHVISLPTPIMAGCRTPVKQFSSCVLIDCDDSLDSITATSSAIINYVSKKAGIGINAGAIRAEGSFVGKDKSIIHTGVIPFLKLFEASVKSCSQGGVRGGAATVNFPIWHLEFPNLIVAKNNKGTIEARVRQVDYCFHFSKLFYERLLKQQDITFFSPADVPGLYDAFYSNQVEFERLYKQYEKDDSIRKLILPAMEVFETFARERKETGRIYLMNVDHANTHSAFIEDVAPIKMTNLCVEVNLTTKPVSTQYPSQGEIALCTLGAINWGLINKPEDFEKPCRVLVRALDNLLDYQDYMHEAAKIATMARRPLGIGIVNLAYFLAKRDLKYNDYALETIDEYAEAWSYYLIKASVDLAIERGACPLSKETKYHYGVVPLDTYKKSVDDLVKRKPKYDWNALRTELTNTGIRNSTLMALMPSETSSQVSNSTNGIEPPRNLVSIKGSKDGQFPQVVPGFHHLKNKYDLLWDQKTPEGYLKVCAVLQKWIDQSISVNTSYNPVFWPKNEIPLSQLIGDILLAYKYGLKTLYYNNTNDNAGNEQQTINQETTSFDDEDCSACKI